MSQHDSKCAGEVQEVHARRKTEEGTRSQRVRGFVTYDGTPPRIPIQGEEVGIIMQSSGMPILTRGKCRMDRKSPKSDLFDKVNFLTEIVIRGESLP